MKLRFERCKNRIAFISKILIFSGIVLFRSWCKFMFLSIPRTKEYTYFDVSERYSYIMNQVSKNGIYVIKNRLKESSNVYVSNYQINPSLNTSIKQIIIQYIFIYISLVLFLFKHVKRKT
jgi:hypothetical protein